jgi:hypothetical protein
MLCPFGAPFYNCKVVDYVYGLSLRINNKLTGQSGCPGKDAFMAASVKCSAINMSSGL